MIWLGELTRMQRAGSILVEIEEKVNNELGSDEKGKPLSWETALRERGLKLTWNYLAIMGTFALIAVGSLVLGAAKGVESGLSEPLVWTLLAVQAGITTALGAFVTIRWRRRPRTEL